MSESKIEWTDRSDWNPIRGCTRESPGCGGPGDHGGCYAEAMAARFSLSAAEVEENWHANTKNAGKSPPIFKDQWGHGFAEMKDGKPRWTGNVEFQEDRLTLPLQWRKPAKIFVSSTSDLFHEKLTDEQIDKIFAVMALCPQHTFQVLTKRAERMRDYMLMITNEPVTDSVKRIVAAWPDKADIPKRGIDIPLPNVWLGVSCERQQEADERIPLLLQTPAAVRFISAEPLLGPIDLTQAFWGDFKDNEWQHSGRPIIDWAIVGGESGPKARPFNLEWADSIIYLCRIAGVACFMKQLGTAPLSDGYPLHLKSSKGDDWSEWPDRLRIREFPSPVIATKSLQGEMSPESYGDRK